MSADEQEQEWIAGLPAGRLVIDVTTGQELGQFLMQNMASFGEEAEEAWKQLLETVRVASEQRTALEAEVERLQEEASKSSRIMSHLADLDRCVHGRHSTDNCSGCGGMSAGNPYLTKGQRLGTSLHGVLAIVWPGYPDYEDPKAWEERL